MISDQKLKELVAFHMAYGPEETMAVYDLNQDTLKRYLRLGKQQYGSKLGLIAKIADTYSEDELALFAKGGKRPPTLATHSISFEGEDISIGVLSDLHIGSRFFHEELFHQAHLEFTKEGVRHIVVPGDVHEGMSGRDGHIYELSHYGYDQQLEKSTELFSQYPGFHYHMISGNHDCLSSDTECLTKAGWKTYDKLTMDDLVYSFDTEKETGQWMPITGLIIKPYKGDMYHFKASGFSQKVTPGHRMLHKTLDGKWVYTLAQDLAALVEKESILFRINAREEGTERPPMIIDDTAPYAIGSPLLRGKRPTVSPYDGIVWCITTPLTNFMIRHEGRTSFTGNCWFQKKGNMGGYIVKALCKSLPNATYAGESIADIIINGAKIRMHHGEDAGGSYAKSYRIQKIVEAIPAGEKPAVLITGHDHKEFTSWIRNVFCVGAGSVQKTSEWMQRTGKYADVGFHIMRLRIKDGELRRASAEWYPAYI